MGETERSGPNQEAAERPEGAEGHETADGLPAESVADEGGAAGEIPAGEGLSHESERPRVEVDDHDEDSRRRLEAKDRHIKELYDELTVVRLEFDEARAKIEAGELRVQDLEEERERLKERLRDFDEEERKRRRWREGQDRRVARLEREIERRQDDIRRLEDLLAREEREKAAERQEAQSVAARKDAALEDALRRVEGLERDLEEREEIAAGLRATIDGLRTELDHEYEFRRRMAEPENRLRAGIDLFNGSAQLQDVDSISKSLGRPEVHVTLEREGDEPPVILTFTWGDVTWRTYVANPDPAVREPRVYQSGAGEVLSSMDREPSNAHLGPGGRVVLGL